MAVLSKETITIEIKGVDGVTRGYNAVRNGQKNVQKSTKKTDEALKNSGDVFDSLKGRVVALQAAFGLVGQGIAGAQRAFSLLRAPIDMAASFETGFARITTLLDGPKSAFEGFRQEILEVAKTSAFAAEDLTTGIYQAISAGIPQEEVIGFMESAEKVAIGANSTLTEAVEVLTTAVNGFKNENMDAAKAANILFATQKAGVTDVKLLGQSLGKATGVAQYGVKLDEVAAAVANMTKLGTPTAEAFTRLNAVVKVLSDDTGESAKHFQALGIEVGVSALKSKGLSGVLKDVQEKTGGSAEAISKLTNRFEAQDGMLKLLGPNYKVFSEILAENRSEADFVGDAYNKMNDTSAMSMKRFRSLTDDVLRRLGEKMLPHLNEMLEELTEYLENIDDETVEGIAEAFGVLVDFGKFIIENAPTIVKGLQLIFGVKLIKSFSMGVGGLISQVKSLKGIAAAAGLKGGGAMLTGFRTAGMAMLRAPHVFAMLAGGAILLGAKLGEAMGNSMGETAAQAAERAAREEKQAEELEDTRVKAVTGMTSDQVKAQRERIESGELLGHHLGIDYDNVADSMDRLGEKTKEIASIQDTYNRFHREFTEQNALLVEQHGENAKLLDVEQKAFEETQKLATSSMEALDTTHDEFVDSYNTRSDKVVDLEDKLERVTKRMDDSVGRGNDPSRFGYQKSVLDTAAKLAKFKQLEADALERINNFDRASIRIREQLKEMDPERLARLAALEEEKRKRAEAAQNEAEEERKREERRKKGAERYKRFLAEQRGIERASVETQGRLARKSIELRRLAFQQESGLFDQRIVMVKNAQGKEEQMTLDHLMNMRRLMEIEGRDLEGFNARFADEFDQQITEAEKRQEQQLQGFIKSSKLLERQQKRDAQALSVGVVDGQTLSPSLRNRQRTVDELISEGIVPAFDQLKNHPRVKELGNEVADIFEAALQSGFAQAGEGVDLPTMLSNMSENLEGVVDAEGLIDPIRVVQEELTQAFNVGEMGATPLENTTEGILRLASQIQKDFDPATSEISKAQFVANGLREELAKLKLPDAVFDSLGLMLTQHERERELLRENAIAQRELNREKREEADIAAAAVIRTQTDLQSPDISKRQAAELLQIEQNFSEQKRALRETENQEGRLIEDQLFALNEAENQARIQAEERHQEELFAIHQQFQDRLATYNGFTQSAELVALARKHEQELIMYEEHGLNVSELVQRQSREMSVLQVQTFAGTFASYAEGAANVTQGIEGIMGSLSQLSQARMRSAKIDLEAGRITQAEYDRAQNEAGGLQEKIIIAQGVYHGFMALSEQANALSAFAEGTLNPVFIAKGLAHQAAAVSHAIQAANAPEMASHARKASSAGAGGGAGGGSMGMSGPRSGGADYMERAELSESQRQNQGVQFGDIILSDLPYLMSADGATQLGRHIAGAVVEEVNNTAQMQGGYRISRRASRRR